MNDKVWIISTVAIPGGDTDEHYYPVSRAYWRRASEEERAAILHGLAERHQREVAPAKAWVVPDDEVPERLR